MTHPSKRALIVDDSRSARAFLSRILENYQIEVDTAESAEHAIQYLGARRPDVIFMDHLMPGMDGFQAVQAIKNDPRTASIPIMMYTSEEGDLYLGKARAIGAAGVLQKQIRPADVSKLLYELQLVPDRRSREPSPFAKLPANASTSAVATPTEVPTTASMPGVQPSAPAKPAPPEAAAAQITPSPKPEPPVCPPASPAAPSPRLLTEPLLREQFADLRRALVASLDTQSERVGADLRLALHDAVRALQSQQREPAPRTPWGWMLAASLALIGMIGSTALWLNETGLRSQMDARIAQLESSLASAVALQRQLEGELLAAEEALGGNPADAPTSDAAGTATDSEPRPRP